MTTKKQLESFYERVKAYRALLVGSRDRALPTIVKNIDSIKEEKQALIREYAKLESFLKKKK